MPHRDEIQFLIDHDDSNGSREVSVIPAISGTSLIDLITDFEVRSGFDPAGGYGGLIPQRFDFGSLAGYFCCKFDDSSPWTRLGGIWVLGCDCGEVGCWPLECKVTIDSDHVHWTNFRQPHRPERDYSAFGPFLFDAHSYQQAVERLIRDIGKPMAVRNPEPAEDFPCDLPPQPLA